MPRLQCCLNVYKAVHDKTIFLALHQMLCAFNFLFICFTFLRGKVWCKPYNGFYLIDVFSYNCCSIFFSLGSGQYKSSNASFLFSLRNPNNMQPFKCPIINGKNGDAIYSHPSYGATFGLGHDLYIYNNANSYTSSYSNLGNTYQPPPGYQPCTQQTQSLFAGSYNFKPTEVEVFY